jgi:hypothetical protein
MNTVQSSSKLEKKYRWGWVFLLPLFLIFSCTVWTVIITQLNQENQDTLEFIPVSMHSVEDADYSGETRELRNPTIKLSILSDIIRDDNQFLTDAEARIEKIFRAISLPIPTATHSFYQITNDETKSEDQLATVIPIRPTQTTFVTKPVKTQQSLTITLGSTSTVVQTSPSSTNTVVNNIFPTVSPTITINPTNTKIPVNTPTKSATLQPTKTPTQNPLLTPLSTSTQTPTTSITPTPTSTSNHTATSTATPTSTQTPSATNSPTTTSIHTATNTPTPTNTPTATNTPTSTETQSSCIPPISDDGELPEGFVQTIDPTDNSSGFPISRNTIIITYNQEMPISGGGSVEKTNSYKLNVLGNVNQAISILSAIYNATTKTVTLTFDKNDSDWITNTQYEIGIRSGIHNLCGTPQSVEVTTVFQTETTP